MKLVGAHLGRDLLRPAPSDNSQVETSCQGSVIPTAYPGAPLRSKNRCHLVANP